MYARNYTMTCPLRVPVSKKKDFIVNMNQYRNAVAKPGGYHIVNNAKKAFKAHMQPQLDNIPVLLKVRIHFVFFANSNTKIDVANVCSITEKFLDDALTERGILLGDDYRYVVGSTYEFGGVDPKNGRVEVRIEEIV